MTKPTPVWCVLCLQLHPSPSSSLVRGSDMGVRDNGAGGAGGHGDAVLPLPRTPLITPTASTYLADVQVRAGGGGTSTHIACSRLTCTNLDTWWSLALCAKPTPTHTHTHTPTHTLTHTKKTIADALLQRSLCALGFWLSVIG